LKFAVHCAMLYTLKKNKEKLVHGRINNIIIRLNKVGSILIFSCSLAIIFLELFIFPQNLFTFDDPDFSSSTDDIIPDTASVPVISMKPDSSLLKPKFRIDKSHHFHPVHPYFRDGYRIIKDMRKLVRMFDYRKINGYESMSDLVEICQKFPESKKTEVIYTALAGGVVNILSEETNKHLRKRKINFLQWKMEKVVLRNKFRYFDLNIHGGVNSKGLGLYIPKFRIYYDRYSTPYYSSESITFWPLRKLGFNYAIWNGSTIITPFISSKIGTIAVSYNKEHKILRTRLDLLKSSSLIIRIVYINYLERMNSNYMLSEVLICW